MKDKARERVIKIGLERWRPSPIYVGDIPSEWEPGMEILLVTGEGNDRHRIHWINRRTNTVWVTPL